MMRTLTQGAGNDENEAWAVVMAAVGKLFEEYFSPVRGLPISEIPKADTDSVSARRFFAKALWSNLQMFELTKELTNSNSGIKNHPIISSAYTEWGLLNSGKPMAAKAIKAAEKTTEEVKEISSSLTKLQKLVNEVQQTAKNAKILDGTRPVTSLTAGKASVLLTFSRLAQDTSFELFIFSFLFRRWAFS